MDQLLRIDADVFQQGLQQVGEGRLADPAQAQGGQGDAQLAGRQVGVQLVVHGAQDAAPPAVLVGDGLDAGGAQLDHGELGGHEEAVEQHEEEGEENQAEIGEIGEEVGTGGRVHGWFLLKDDRLRLKAAPRVCKSGYSVDHARRATWVAGKWQVKVLPWLSTELMSRRPRWRISTCLTMARPRPVPPVLLLRLESTR
ncbi:hypothetical protein D9M68_675610 [compost metagenome]